MAYQSCRIKQDDANALVVNPCVIAYLTARRLWLPFWDKLQLQLACQVRTRMLATGQVAGLSRGGQFDYGVF